MTLNYSKVWNVMNDIEESFSQIAYFSFLLERLQEAVDKDDRSAVVDITAALNAFYPVYTENFDEKFKVAWDEVVVTLKRDEENLEKDKIIFCNKDDSSDECKKSWDNFWSYDHINTSYPGDTITFNFSENEDKVKKWVLPVQEIENGDTSEQEYFIQLPDDLLEQTAWKENDTVSWEDNGNGTFILRKVNG